MRMPPHTAPKPSDVSPSGSVYPHYNLPHGNVWHWAQLLENPATQTYFIGPFMKYQHGRLMGNGGDL